MSTKQFLQPTAVGHVQAFVHLSFPHKTQSLGFRFFLQNKIGQKRAGSQFFFSTHRLTMPYICAEFNKEILNVFF